MNKLFKPTLLIVPLLALTSCDKVITKQEAQARSKTILDEQVNVDYSKGTYNFQTGIQVSGTEDDDTIENQLLISSDPSNYYLYLKNSSPDGVIQKYIFSCDEGLVLATNEYNAFKNYRVLASDTTSFDEAYKTISDDLNTMNDAINKENEDFLAKLANGEDITDSINTSLKTLEDEFDVSASYEFKYVADDENSVGFDATNSFDFIGAIKETSTCKACWYNNMFSSLELSAKVEVLDAKFVVAASANYSPNVEFYNIDLSEYTKIE